MNTYTAQNPINGTEWTCTASTIMEAERLFAREFGYDIEPDIFAVFPDRG